MARLHPIPLRSQPRKRSGKLQLQTVQFTGSEQGFTAADFQRLTTAGFFGTSATAPTRRALVVITAAAVAASASVAAATATLVALVVITFASSSAATAPSASVAATAPVAAAASVTAPMAIIIAIIRWQLRD